MKPLFTILLVLLSITNFKTIAANQQLVTMTVTKIDDYVKGNRAPSKSIDCTIDFGTYTIISSFAQDVIRYDVYSENSSELLYSTDNESDFIEYMETLDGEYVVVFNAADYKYIGVITLLT